MTSPSARFSAAVELAMSLPTPAEINEHINATSDDGLRAGSYEARVRGQGERLTHPEEGAERRLAGDVKDDRGDQVRLRDAGNQAVDAIASLNAICRDAPPPRQNHAGITDWDDLLWCCQVLLGQVCNDPNHLPADHDEQSDDDNPWDCKQLASIRSAITSDATRSDTIHWIDKFESAVRDINGVHDRHMAHPPTDLDRLIEGEPICLSHARIGDYDRSRHGDFRVCKSPCYDLILAKAKRWGLKTDDLAADPDEWPPTSLLREHADMVRTSRKKDYRDARQQWIETYRVERTLRAC